MTATTKRRGPIRLPSALRALVGSPDWLEVEQAGAVFKAPGSLLGANSQSIYANTVLQLPFSASFADVSPLAMTATPSGSVAITGGVAVFSGAGGEIDYSTALSLGASALDLGLFWTLEGWFKTNQATQFMTFFERSVGSATSTFELLINNGSANDGKIAMYAPDGTPCALTAHGFLNNAWHHVRYVKYANENLIWVDGVLEAFSVVNPINNWTTSNAMPRIGASSTPGRAFIGSLHDWRLVKGIAVSTTPKITVPSFPFPTA